MFDPKSIKQDFPIFKRPVRGKSLTYLDNAATTQKPTSVIRALKNYYTNLNANIHRGIHELSEKSTIAYEKTRAHTAKFINANSPKEIVFTRNTTEAINLVAYTWGEENIQKNDEIILSELEHHSNLLPWQQLAKRKKATLKFIPTKKDLSLDLQVYYKMLSEKTALVAISKVSNVLGTITNIQALTKEAHKYGARVLIDGAQSVPHLPTNVQSCDCDFLVFSAHKMLGPTGVGVLYAKQEILENMPPFFTGGGMVKEVGLYKSSFADIPHRFEAGTPAIADVIAFDKAITYLEKIGMQTVQNHCQKLTQYAIKIFQKYSEVKLFLPEENVGILSFTIKGIHPHDIAQIFDHAGIAIRAGHHCCQPLMKVLNVPATARLSFYIYNDEDDIDLAEKALRKTINTFQ